MLTRGFEERDIVGLDTETVKGKPYTAQLWSPGRPVYQEFPERRPEAITAWLLDTMSKYPPNTAFYAHNLTFDLFVLLYKFRKAFLNTHFLLKGRGLTIEVFYGKVTYAVVNLDKRPFLILDTFAFFKASLAQLAKLFDLGEKLKAPRGLGEKRLKGRAWKAYAMRDAEIAYGVGKAIEKFHHQYDIPQTISAPQMSARIFRKHYIPPGSAIPCPPRDCMQAAELSYHGGKNGLYVPPGLYKGVGIYDINSAYPFAFTKLPNFLDCEYEYHRGKLPQGRAGILCLSGVSSGNPYNLLRDHRFAAVSGPFTSLWITSYELGTMRKHGFLKHATVEESWSVVPNPKRANPLSRFARDFYKLKSESKGVLREFYKIVLNSLYGKFVQNIRDDDKDFVLNENDVIEMADTDYVAGGLYNPLLASLITGYVRAYLTEWEIESHSLHSSTDSVMSKGVVPVGDDLGDLSMKTRGDCVLLRPKLYVSWNHRKEITHYALHGFHGNIGQFLNLLRSGKRGYKHTRMLKVKESERDGETPLTMKSFFKTINLPFSGALDIPALTLNGRKV